MTDHGPFSDDISQLWGPEDPDVLEPAPLRRPERRRPDEEPLVVLQREVRRLQQSVAALDAAAVRREAAATVEAGLAEMELRLAGRLDEVGRRLDDLAEMDAARGRELGRLASAVDARDDEPAGRYRRRRGRPERPAGGDPDARLAELEARIDGRLDDLAERVEALVERRAPRSPAPDSPTNGHQPVEGVGAPVV